MRARKVLVARNGGPEVMEVVEEELTDPGPGEAQVRVLASGVAFGDVLKRRGAVPGMPKPPFTPGYDLVGMVERLGPDCSRAKVGEVVAAYVFNGANAERVNVREDTFVPVPEGIDPAEAVTLVLNYVTAWQMLHRVARVESGQDILIHGAAGGVGTAMLQLARLAGVRAFGTASEGKHELVRRMHGIPIDYRNHDWVTEVLALSGGGVAAVFDPIGGTHLAKSHRLVRRGGILVAFGASDAVARGASEALSMMLRLAWYKLVPDGRRAAFYGIRDQRTIQEDLRKIFELYTEGKLEPIVAERLPLTEARRAHELIEASAVAGKLVLVP